MQLVVITPSRTLENEHSIIVQLFENGLETIHIRKPNYTTLKLQKYIEKIPAQYHNRLVIHSHHWLARKYALKGIHLTAKHKVETFRNKLSLTMLKMLRPNLSLSTSVDNLGSVTQPVGHYHYLLLSPAFDSTDHKYQKGYSDFALQHALLKTPQKIIARGGVNHQVVQKAFGLGFHGLALTKCIWENPNPIEEFKRIISACEKFNIRID